MAIVGALKMVYAVGFLGSQIYFEPVSRVSREMQSVLVPCTRLMMSSAIVHRQLAYQIVPERLEPALGVHAIYSSGLEDNGRRGRVTIRGLFYTSPSLVVLRGRGRLMFNHNAHRVFNHNDIFQATIRLSRAQRI